MAATTHTARIIGPVSYLSAGGLAQQIPIGPCLVEMSDGRVIDIVWGAHGQRSAALAVEAIEAAQDEGHLLLLD